VPVYGYSVGFTLGCCQAYFAILKRLYYPWLTYSSNFFFQIVSHQSSMWFGLGLWSWWSTFYVRGNNLFWTQSCLLVVEKIDCSC